MKELRDYYSNELIVDFTDELPPAGEYYSIVVDFNYVPVDETLGCFVFKYKLADCTTLNTYNFTEAYYCGGHNPKTKDLCNYFIKHGIEYKYKNQLVGLREKVFVSLDYLGSMEHPIICDRTLIAKPSHLEEDDVDIEEEDVDFETYDEYQPY